MNIYYVAASLAVLTWAITPIINTSVVRHTGVTTVIRWKKSIAGIFLWSAVAYNSTMGTIIDDNSVIIVTALSGLVVFLSATQPYIQP